jgi:hypothetical protein
MGGAESGAADRAGRTRRSDGEERDHGTHLTLIAAHVLTPESENLSSFIWRTRYRDPSAVPPESTIANTWDRVARSVAALGLRYDSLPTRNFAAAIMRTIRPDLLHDERTSTSVGA